MKTRPDEIATEATVLKALGAPSWQRPKKQTPKGSKSEGDSDLPCNSSESNGSSESGTGEAEQLDTSDEVFDDIEPEEDALEEPIVDPRRLQIPEELLDPILDIIAGGRGEELETLLTGREPARKSEPEVPPEWMKTLRKLAHAPHAGEIGEALEKLLKPTEEPPLPEEWTNLIAEAREILGDDIKIGISLRRFADNIKQKYGSGV